MNTWTTLPVGYWDPAPYPGERPDCSWRLAGDSVHRVVPAGLGGWLDTVTGEEIDLNGRVFILAYGSNANPTKLLGIDAVMLRAEITDARAVWSSGRRGRDNSVVATIARLGGHVEACPVLAVDHSGLQRVDAWEGTAYRRSDFWGRCTLENGQEVSVQVYVGGASRQPLLIDGNHLPLHDADHHYVDGIVS
jgi:hypothetical protein